MKTLTLLRFLVVVVICSASALGVAAQEDERDPAGDSDRPMVDRPQDPRFNMLRQLGLSRDQIQQIRRMNIARRPLVESAQAKLREANRQLDAAIYADEVNEEELRARLKDAQLAQAELIRIRSMDELSVRRLLTPEQLTRFRQMRARFDQARENFQDRRPMNRPVGGNGFQNRRNVKTQDAMSSEPKAKP